MKRFRQFSPSIVVLVATLTGSPAIVAQATSPDQSWTSTNQQGTPNGAINPTRTHQTHSESNGRVVDKTSVERLGPDGRYIPYSDTERESIRVDDSTTRVLERTYGCDADGRRNLIQEEQQESRSLAGGDRTLTRTISAPDGNGAMQVTRRETEHTKQLSPSVQVTTATVLSPDVNGGLAPSVRTEHRETRGSDGTVQSRKSTLLPDGNGGWQLSEVRDTTSKPEGQGTITKEERVLRPDSNGNLAVVERRVNRQSHETSGDKRETTDTYSTNVPGEASDGALQLIRRETTVHRATSGGGNATKRQVEQPVPGSFNADLRVTEQAIDIIRPAAGGTANETYTIQASDADGHLTQVSVDMGKTSNPSAVQVDMAPAQRSK